MQHVYFEVKGEPVPKARARTVRKGGRTWSFTPKRVAVWEKTVKEEAAKYFEEPLVGPIQVSLIFYMERPKSRRKDIWVPTCACPNTNDSIGMKRSRSVMPTNLTGSSGQ